MFVIAVPEWHRRDLEDLAPLDEAKVVIPPLTLSRPPALLPVDMARMPPS